MRLLKTSKRVRQFETVGWFQEVMIESVNGWKLAGRRRLESQPAGPLGVAGERSETITSPLELYTGCGTPYTLKASLKKPVAIKLRDYPICGPLEK